MFVHKTWAYIQGKKRITMEIVELEASIVLGENIVLVHTFLDYNQFCLYILVAIINQFSLHYF